MVYSSPVRAHDSRFTIHDSRGARRVPERRLLAFCALGGSPAFLAGMFLFRHKTRKPKFYAGVPLILAVQLILLLLALRSV